VSEDSFVNFNRIYGADAEHRTPYMTRCWIGRLRLHIFHRGDADPDPHDHPWDFWTFPLTSYVEEVVGWHPDRRFVFRQVVKAFQLHYRPAEHTHRVLGRVGKSDTLGLKYAPELHARMSLVRPGKIITIVWRGRNERRWGFLKHRDGTWCWVHWREYVFGGGKHAPCEPSEGADA